MAVNANKATEYLKKYGICKGCGNNKVGNGEGKLCIDTVKGYDFVRTCKCGWRIEIKSKESEADNNE